MAGAGGGWWRVRRFCMCVLVPFWVFHCTLSLAHKTSAVYRIPLPSETPHPSATPAMRKAQGLARGRSRRKQQGGDGPAQQQAAQGGGGGPAAQHHLQNQNGGGGPEGGGPPQPAPQRRKPTPEEQALTAKNYRLAKELVS
jgi:hypothetical protein